MLTEALAIIRDYRTCEFTTLRNGSPQTWPVSSLLLNDGRFLITTGIGLPQKALNVRRNFKVSLLFSDPTGSGVDEPGAVLVQGDATSQDRIVADISSDPNFTALAATVTSRQPASFFMTSRVGRRLFPYYWMRIPIYVTPRGVYFWPARDFTKPPQHLDPEELRGVG